MTAQGFARPVAGTGESRFRHPVAGTGDLLATLPVMNRRPQLSITAPEVSAEEAAAIVAALERFMRDTAPRRSTPPPQRSPWARAALLEATGHEPGAGSVTWGA